MTVGISSYCTSNNVGNLLEEHTSDKKKKKGECEKASEERIYLLN